MMGFSMEINKDTLRSPRNRVILLVLAAVLAVLCLNGNLGGRSFEREDMTPMTAVFKECRYKPNANHGSLNSNDIYLVFEDGEQLSIHANCATDELTQRLFTLESGTRMKMLVDSSTQNITELTVEGQKWLSFETVQSTMNRLDVYFGWAGYALIAIAVALVASLVPVLLEKSRKEEE